MAASLAGILVGLLIGAGCRFFDIPSPAPLRLIGALLLVAITLGFVAAGALLVVAMTTGYLLVDRFMARPAVHAADCGGPSGVTVGGAAAGIGSPDSSGRHVQSDPAA
jgi:XapX domain-containing protein